MAEWYVVQLPKGVEFTYIKKEKDCQGRLILIYEEDGEDACWLSQSMPAVVRAINNVVSKVALLVSVSDTAGREPVSCAQKLSCRCVP